MPRPSPNDWAKTIGALPRATALSRTGRILAVTKEMESALGLPLANIMGKTCREVLAPFRPDCEHCPIAETLGPADSHTEKEAIEYSHDSPSPPKRPICLPLEGQGPDLFVHLLYASPDAGSLLTLLSTMDRLQLVEDRMAYLIHELNNYLTAIAGHAELILVEDVRMTRQHAGVIFRAVDRCHQLLVKARGWRSVAPGRTSRISPLRTVIEELEETCRFALQTNRATLVAHLEEGIPALAMDSTELLQVLSNLVINAAQAGRVNSTETTVTLTARRRGDRATLEVSDNGPGIPADLLDHIFDPYFTTKPKGTGLGLALAKALVERAGGSIEAASDGTGATFRIELPLVVKTSDRG